MKTDASGDFLRGSGAAPASAPPSVFRGLFPLIFCVAFVLTACSGTASLVISGASTLQPVVTEIAQDYEAEFADIRVHVLGGGTGQGINAVLKGRADLAMVARELTESERSRLDVKWIAQDGIAIVTHVETQIADPMTLARLRALYASEAAGSLQRVRKQASHGTAAAFAAALDLPAHKVKGEFEAGSNGEVLAMIARSPNLIGFVSNSDAAKALEAGDPIRVLPVDGVLPTMETIRGGTYPIRRRLGLAWLKPGKDAHGYLRILRFLEFVSSAPKSVRRFNDHGFAAN